MGLKTWIFDKDDLEIFDFPTKIMKNQTSIFYIYTYIPILYLKIAVICNVTMKFVIFVIFFVIRNLQVKEHRDFL